MIYVLVYVSYDYHRFQDNVYASTSKKKCINWYNKNKHTYESILNPDLPLITDENKSQDMWDKEIHHFWLEEFKNK